MKSNSHSPPRHRGNYAKWNIVFAGVAVFGAVLAMDFSAQLVGTVPVSEITWSPIVAKAFVAVGAISSSLAIIGLVFNMAYVHSSSAPPPQEVRRVDKHSAYTGNRRTKTDIGAMMKKILDALSAGMHRHRLVDGGIAGSTGYVAAA